MKIQRRSTWKNQREDWYREAARTEVREAVGVEAVALVIAATIFTLYGAKSLDTWGGAGSVLVGTLCAALGAGLWWGHKWALRFGGVILASAVMISLVALPVSLLMGYRMDLADIVFRGFLLVTMWQSAQGLFELAKKPVIPELRSRSEATDPGTAAADSQE